MREICSFVRILMLADVGYPEVMCGQVPSGDCLSWNTRYSQQKMANGVGVSYDVSADIDWFDRYNTKGNFDMDACFNAFDKDG